MTKRVCLKLIFFTTEKRKNTKFHARIWLHYILVRLLSDCFYVIHKNCSFRQNVTAYSRRQSSIIHFFFKFVFNFTFIKLIMLYFTNVFIPNGNELLIMKFILDHFTPQWIILMFLLFFKVIYLHYFIVVNNRKCKKDERGQN